MTWNRARVGDVRSALLAALGCMAILSTAGCAATYSDRPVDPETGILNFAKVSDALYRGGQPDAQGFARLKAMGVRTVVSLRTFDLDRPLLKGLGLKYVHISFKAGHPEDKDVVAFLKVVTDPANQPVFVHCKWGADRAGMMAAVYRVVVQGWARDQALDEMRDMGFSDGWHGIEEYVEHLDAAALRHKMKDAPAPKVTVTP